MRKYHSVRTLCHDRLGNSVTIRPAAVGIRGFAQDIYKRATFVKDFGWMVTVDFFPLLSKLKRKANTFARRGMRGCLMPTKMSLWQYYAMILLIVGIVSAAAPAKAQDDFDDYYPDAPDQGGDIPDYLRAYQDGTGAAAATPPAAGNASAPRFSMPPPPAGAGAGTSGSDFYSGNPAIDNAARQAAAAQQYAGQGGNAGGQDYADDEDLYAEEDEDVYAGGGAGTPGQDYPQGGTGGEIGGPDAEGNMVTAIDVVNTVTTTPEQIIYRMSTRVGHPLRERTLDGDFQRLASMGVFDDIQIKKEMVPGGVRIIVVVREKDIIRRIEFTGNTQIKTKKISKLIESRVGERYDAGKGNRDRRAIEDFLHKEYYYFGEVETVVEPFEDGVRLVFDISEGGRLYVGDIQFRGNSVFTRKALLAKMETKRSGLISRGKYLRRAFERDLERIRMSYLDKGFLDVRVIERPMQITANEPTSRFQRRDVFLHVDIDEGEEYRVGRVNFDFLNTSLVPEEAIRAAIKTIPGGVYSPITIQEDAMKIRDVYGMSPNSRYFTKVMPEPEITEDGLVMDVTFRIQESPEIVVEGVRVTGLTHTKEVVVLREFELFPGEKIDSRKFRRSKENIENLGYFKERPNIEIREGSTPDRAILVAELEEIPTGKITAGVGVSSQDSIVGSFGVSQRNFDYKDRPKSFRDFYTGKSFRGAGQSFSINASAGSETQSYSANFTNPWIFGKPISMSLGAYYNQYKYDGEYHERRIGGNWIYGKRLFGLKDLTISGGYRFEMVKLSNFQNTGYSEEYLRQEGDHNVSRWVMGVNYDSRDSQWEPTRGALVGANLELAGTVAGSSKDFWRGFLTGQYLIPLYVDSQERNWTLGFRGDYAIAQAYGDGDGEGQLVNVETGARRTTSYRNEVPYYERFHLGGVGSVRGFDYRGISPRDNNNNAIGGESMASASVEFFFPIWDRLVRGSVFYDIGSVWRYSDDPDYNEGVSRSSLGTYNAAKAQGEPDPEGYKRRETNTERKFRSSMGFGLHIKTPMGPMPVRLYYAIPLNKQEGDKIQRFQFTMGALF